MRSVTKQKIKHTEKHSSQIWAVVAASGTAGHVYPGIAVAQVLTARGLKAHFAISKTGVGAKGVEQAGFSYTLISGRGIRRSFSPKAIWANFLSLGKLAAGSWQIFNLLRRLRPRILLSMGGYIGLIAAQAAFVLRIPVVTAEQNAVPGLANKLSARFSKALAIAFPDTDLPKATYTGNPVRQEIIEAAASRAERNEAGSEGNGRSADELRVVILGGSLGAGCINSAVAEALKEMSASPVEEKGGVAGEELTHTSTRPLRLHFFHITGDREWVKLASSRELAKTKNLNYDSVPFAHNMSEVFSSSQLAVGRAGAGMVAEVAAMGLPAILIPLQKAPNDHQTANAEALAKTGAAICIPEPDFNGTRLLAEIDQLCRQPETLTRMADQAANFAHPNAAEKIADLLFENAKPLDGGVTSSSASDLNERATASKTETQA